MNQQGFSQRLLASAQLLGWPAELEPDFESQMFRGRNEVAASTLPHNIIGLRLGAYPLLVAPISLDSTEGIQASLRSLHSQMVIARSYMRAEEVINAHIMLCATTTELEADWRGLVDLAERDEAVCRKVVWVPDTEGLDASYDSFIERTFLAQPWRSIRAVLDAPLDHNQELAERILVKHGVSETTARRWIKLAEMHKDEPDLMIEQLVATQEYSV